MQPVYITLFSASTQLLCVFRVQWREAGVYMQPVYTGSSSSSSGGEDREGQEVDVDRLAAHGNGQHKAAQEALLDTLEQSLFVREGGFNSEYKDFESEWWV